MGGVPEEAQNSHFDISLEPFWGRGRPWAVEKAVRGLCVRKPRYFTRKPGIGPESMYFVVFMAPEGPAEYKINKGVFEHTCRICEK